MDSNRLQLPRFISLESYREFFLQGIQGVVVYLDDILITGDTEEAHLKASRGTCSP